MILERLKMSNFRCYNRVTEIEFCVAKDKNVTIVHGNNGAGKTSILHALNFVLYGRKAVTSDSPLINRESLKAASEANMARAVVILDFLNAAERYRLTRSVKGYASGERVNEFDDKLTLYRTDEAGNTDNESQPQVVLERMLPSAIRSFFIFDGDRIADLARPGAERNKEINKAVRDVLHIEALNRGAEHTKTLAATYRRKLEQSEAPNIASITSRRMLSEANRKRIADKLDSLSAERTEIERRTADVDAEIADIIEVAQKAVERQKLRGERDNVLARIDGFKRRAATESLRAIPLLVNQQLANAAKRLDEYKGRHEIPARIADHFIRELLERDECICGRTLDDKDARSALKCLLESVVPGSLQDVATNVMARIREIVADGTEARSGLTVALQGIKDARAEVDKIEAAIERIGEQIDESAVERAKGLNAEYRHLNNRSRQIQHEIGAAQFELKSADRAINSLDEQLSQEAARQKGFKELTQLWNLARDCNAVLSSIQKDLERHLQLDLASEGTAILRELASDEKKYFFDRMEIGDGFLLKVIDNRGNDVRPQLSMGETQVSSLAFILGMTRLGGQEAPLVIDTPLARLDPSVRAHAAQYLPQLARQLILLVTDAEYDESVKMLRPRSCRQYRLSPDTNGTKVTTA